MLTTGPFLEATANGALPGSDITAKDGKVNLKVKIQCTDWVHINRVQVLVNGRQDPNLNITAEKNPKMFNETPTVFETTFSLDLKEDTHLIVVAMGENADLKTGYGTSTNASLKPCAYINPIWVDTDGNGFQPNKVPSAGTPLADRTRQDSCVVKGEGELTEAVVNGDASGNAAGAGPCRNRSRLVFELQCGCAGAWGHVTGLGNRALVIKLDENHGTLDAIVKHALLPGPTQPSEIVLSICFFTSASFTLAWPSAICPTYTPINSSNFSCCGAVKASPRMPI